MHTGRDTLFAVISLTIAACAASAAQAQESTSGTELEEIVVTAQKRSESLQRVPLSIAAFTPAALEGKQINDAASLQVAVPGLVYSNSGGFATPYIRGIGSDIATVGAEPGVATYIDGVYVSNPLSVNMDLVDVERVEVVKGPQGTLYGRNAIGGAINIITREPGQELEGQVSAGFGNHSRYDLAGFVSGGVTDTLALGLYANFVQRDSLTTNLANPSPDLVPDDKQDVSVRAKAVFTPTENTKFVLSGEYADTDAPDIWSFRQVQDNALGTLAGGQTSTRPRTVYHNYPSYQTSRLYAGTLRAEVDLAFAKLVSISGYRDFESVASVDYDGTDAQVLGFAIRPATSQQFSQEVQLVSRADSTVRWITGLYYFDEKTSGRFDLNPGDLLVNLNPNLPVESYAAFAEVTVPVTEKLEMTGGARFTHEKKSVDSEQIIPAFGVRDTLPSQEKTFEEPTWKVALQYQVNPELMSYASYSRGFQSGAFNAVDTGAPPVDAETLDAYEIGLKSELFDRRLQANFSAFYYDFKDLQVQVNDDSGAAASFQNAGAASVQGLEASFRALVSQGLELDAGFSFLDSEYKDFQDYAGFERDPAGGNRSISADVTGNSVVRAPEFTGTLGATYTAELANAGSLIFNAAYYYNDGFAFDPQHLVEQKAYSLVNASVTWAPKEAYRVMAWVQNLTDEDYLGFGVASNQGTTYFDMPGRLYGARFTYNFGR